MALGVESSASNQSTLYSYSVPTTDGYDSNGNVLSYTDSVMGSWTFGYDQLNRLTTAVNPNVPAGASWTPNFCWAYDSFGNRLQQSQSDQPFTTNNGSCTPTGSLYQNTLATYNNQNQMTNSNASGILIAPSYDGAGDVVADGTNAYLYDAEGRICAVYSASGMTGYQYDAAGNRVAKGVITAWSCDITTNGFAATSGYVVGPSGEQLTEVDGSGNWQHTNVYAGGKRIATYDGNVASPTLHFHIDDPLGTRRAQVSATGALEATYQSLPFGDGLNSIPYTNAGDDDPTENHFTNKERDTESGNDYFGARYYNSNTGRWLSPDMFDGPAVVPYASFADPQTLNLYNFVLNNPLRMVDADGHSGCAIEGVGTNCSSISAESAVQCPDNQCTGVNIYWHSPSGGKLPGDLVIEAARMTQFTAGADGSEGYSANTTEIYNTLPDPARVAAQYENDVPILANQLKLTEQQVRSMIKVAKNPDGSDVVIGGHINMTVQPGSLAADHLASLLGADKYNGGEGSELSRLGGLTPSVHLDNGLVHVDRFNAGALGYLGVVPHAIYDVFGGGGHGTNPMLPY